MTPAEFWERVDVNGPGGCWLWTGKRAAGYGQAWINGSGRRKGSHRIAYELLVGEIAPGLELDHLCETTLCVNPAHLEPVTHQENMQRWWDRGGPVVGDEQLAGNSTRNRVAS